MEQMKQTNKIILIKLLLGMAVSTGCLLWVLKDVNLTRLRLLTLGVNPLYILLVNFLLAISLWARSARWRIFMLSSKLIPLGLFYSANLIGFMANNLLPARLGEIVRAYSLHRLAGISTASALATIVLERILDGLTLLFILFVALFFADSQSQAGEFNVRFLHRIALILLGTYISVTVVVISLWCWPNRTVGYLCGIAGRIHSRLGFQCGKILKNFSQGLAILSQSRHLPLIGIQTLGVWAPVVFSYVVFLPALGLPWNPYFGVMAFVGSSLGSVVPAGPGYVGTFQLAVTWMMILAGADPELAAAYSIIYWAVQYFPVIFVGLFEMGRRGLQFASISGLKNRQDITEGL